MRMFLMFLKLILSALLGAVGVICFNDGRFEAGISLFIMALIHWLFWPQPKPAPKVMVPSPARAADRSVAAQSDKPVSMRKVSASGSGSVGVSRHNVSAGYQRREAERRAHRDDSTLLMAAMVVAPTDDDCAEYNIGVSDAVNCDIPATTSRSETFSTSYASSAGYSSGGDSGSSTSSSSSSSDY